MTKSKIGNHLAVSLLKAITVSGPICLFLNIEVSQASQTKVSSLRVRPAHLQIHRGPAEVNGCQPIFETSLKSVETSTASSTARLEVNEIKINRGYERKPVDFNNDFSFLAGSKESGFFGRTTTTFSKKWDTQIYWTNTAVPNSDGTIPLVNPDSKGVFIFLHGSGTMKSSGRNFVQNMNTAAVHGFSALSFDSPFHADGPTDPSFNKSDVYMEWLKGIIEEVKTYKKPIYLVGHSFGPDVALEIAARYPYLVDGVLAISPAGFNKVLEDWYTNFTSKMNFGGNVATNVPAATWAGSVSQQFLWKTGRLADPTKVNPNLKVVIVYGDQEEYFPAPVGGPNGTPIGKNTYDVAPFLKSRLADSQIVVLPNIGHYLFDYRDQNGNNAITREMLRIAGMDIKDSNQIVRATKDLEQSYISSIMMGKKYATDFIFRAWSDEKYGKNYSLKVFNRRNDAKASEILAAYDLALKQRQKEIFQKILDSKTNAPEFYEKYKSNIDRYDLKRVENDLFPAYFEYLQQKNGSPDEIKTTDTIF